MKLALHAAVSILAWVLLRIVMVALDLHAPVEAVAPYWLLAYFVGLTAPRK